MLVPSGERVWAEGGADEKAIVVVDIGRTPRIKAGVSAGSREVAAPGCGAAVAGVAMV